VTATTSVAAPVRAGTQVTQGGRDARLRALRPRMRNGLTLVAVVIALAGMGLARPAQASDRADNGRITFGRFDPTLGDFSIWAADPDGTHQRRLTTVPSFFSDWSPDGRRIAFDFVDDVGVHIATMAPDGGQQRQLTSGPAIQEVPKWSPDGRWITFDAAPVFPDDPAFSTSIWVIRADGSDARQLTRDGFDVEPVFSPDGTRVVFGRITGVSAQGDQMEALYVVNTDGTGLHQIVAPRAGLEHPDWSPDGRLISFNIAPEAAAASESGSVMVVHPDGGSLQVLRRPTERLRFFKPVWSPDGRKMLIGCRDVSAHIDKLCTMDANGRNVNIIVDTTPDPANFPAWGSHPIRR
jgi:Tol biopolymer transport system component